MLARAGDGQLVEQFEKRGAELFQKVAGFSLVRLLFCPSRKGFLRGGESFPKAADSDGFRERVVAIFREEIELVAQVLKVVVDWCGREKKDLGADAGFDDVVHESLVAALLNDIALLVLPAWGVVPEIVRLVDDDEVVISPVQRREVDVAGVAALAAEIGVGDDIEAKAVRAEGIEKAVGIIDRPVVAKLFRAENKDPLVLQLEIFHDCQGLVGFSESNAIRDDAPVVSQNFIDSTFGAVLLKLKEGFPNFAFKEAGLAKVCIRLARVAKELLEDVIERLIVDEFRSVVFVKLLEVVQDIRLHIFYQILVRPNRIEPLFEFMSVAVAVHDEIELDVVSGTAKT